MTIIECKTIGLAIMLFPIYAALGAILWMLAKENIEIKRESRRRK